MYRPLRIARICPKCKTPVLLRVSVEEARGYEVPVLEAAIAMAWSDGRIDPREREHIDHLLDSMPFDQADKERLHGLVANGLEPSAVSLPAECGPEAVDAILAVAAAMVVADHNVHASEVRAFLALAEQLGLGDKMARRRLREYERQIAV